MTTAAEAKFSANFKMFNVDGLAVQFTVREDDQQKHMALLQAQLDTLTRNGWRVTEPTGNLKPRILHVTGWVKGTAENKRDATFQPCAHLYADYGEYKQCTVYHERLSELPVDGKAAKTWDGAAPDKATAAKRGVMNHCAFDVILEPIILPDGNPKVNEKGYTQYKFGGVKAAALEPEPKISMDSVGEMDPDPGLWEKNNGNGKAAKQNGKPVKPAEFVWHVDDEWLGIAAGIIQMGELTGKPADLVTYITKLHNESNGKPISVSNAEGKGSGQYGFLVSLLDKRYGKDSHRMILSCLCSTPVTGDTPPGWKVKELLEWLKDAEANQPKLVHLDTLVEFIKGVVVETEAA